MRTAFLGLFLAVHLFLSTNCVNGQYSQNEETNGYGAIRSLHQLLDDDLSGYIDVKESDEFLKDELNIQSKHKDRLKVFHKGDPQITVDELWKSWQVSDVHNWTTEDVIQWLVYEVELPQYSDNFRQNNLNGSCLPRVAVNNPEFLTLTLGIRDPIHKKKLTLKATDAVLFGSPKHRGSFGPIKEWILLSSVFVATFGVWFAYSQRKKYEKQIGHLSAELRNIQKLEEQFKELGDNRTEKGSDSPSSERGSPGFGATTQKLEEAEHQIAVLQEALRRAEQRVDCKTWAPPVELELLLQKTYKIEGAHFKTKQAAVEKQLMAARTKCEDMSKKKKAPLAAFISIHGDGFDSVDDEICKAKIALEELKAEMSERRARWTRVEDITGLAIATPGAARFAPLPAGLVTIPESPAIRPRDLDVSSIKSFGVAVSRVTQVSVNGTDSHPFVHRNSDAASMRTYMVTPSSSFDSDESASRRLPESSSPSPDSQSLVSRSTCGADLSPPRQKEKKEKKGMKKVLSGIFGKKTDHG